VTPHLIYPVFALLVGPIHVIQTQIDNITYVYHIIHMLTIEKTDIFLDWLRSLRDLRAMARIQIRIDRLALGNAGDVNSVGEGVSELRVDYGPGYRVYYAQHGKALVVLLCGGDKRTQSSDIAMAKKLAKEIKYGT
jgi:putative addiction module killer protein